MKNRNEYIKEKTAELLKKAGEYSRDLEIVAEWVADLHWQLEDIQEMILSTRQHISDQLQKTHK